MFIADFTLGGAERVFSDLAKGFSEKGHQVELVIGNTDNAVYLDLIPDKVRVVNLKVRQMRRSLPALVGYLRKNKPDIVLATRADSCPFVILAKIFSRVRTAVVLREANTLSSDLNKYPRGRKLLLSLFIKTLYPLADLIIGVSEGVKNDLKKFLRIKDDKLCVIYSPIVTEELFVNASKPCTHPWLQNVNIPVILSVGRLTRQKRFDLLIKAFAIAREHRNMRLLILGEGEERPCLESLIEGLKLREDVALVGFEANPFKYMSRARLFVLSSDWEGLPGALVQALACGCPVVSTDCPSGPREILKNGQLGRLVPVGDVKAMASAIEEVLSQKVLRVKKEDLSEYAADKSIDNYLRIFEAVTNE